MSIRYSYLNKIDQKKTKYFALFSDDNFKILNFKNLDFKDRGKIDNLINNNKDQKKFFCI